MKKLLKKSTAVVLIFLLCVFSVSAKSSRKLPSPTSDFFVADFAGVLKNEDYEKIFSQAKNLYYACKAQAVVVTVESLGGEEIEDYAYDLANEWKIGDKDEDSGVLLLLSVSDRRVRIEVGSGLEGALPDSKTGRILDTYGMDYFKNEDFSAGLCSVYNSIVNEIYIEYGLSPDENYEPVEDEIDIQAIFSVIMVIIFLLIVFSKKRFIIFGGFPGGRGGRGGFSGGGGGFSGGGSSRRF